MVNKRISNRITLFHGLCLDIAIWIFFFNLKRWDGFFDSSVSQVFPSSFFMSCWLSSDLIWCLQTLRSSTKSCLQLQEFPTQIFNFFVFKNRILKSNATFNWINGIRFEICLARPHFSHVELYWGSWDRYRLSILCSGFKFSRIFSEPFTSISWNFNLLPFTPHPRQIKN